MVNHFVRARVSDDETMRSITYYPPNNQLSSATADKIKLQSCFSIHPRMATLRKPTPGTVLATYAVVVPTTDLSNQSRQMVVFTWP